VLTLHSGVLRIDDGKVTTVIPASTGASSIFSSIASAPSGELWFSDWQGVRALDLAGRLRTIRAVKDGPLYEHLALRSPSDVWATSDGWAILHHDGKAWTKVRERGQFPGKYEDNKLDDLAITSDAVWVSCSNGLWRGAGADWQKVELPAGAAGWKLGVYRDRLVIAGPLGYFSREGGGWRKLPLPEKTTLRWAMSDTGIVAAPSAGGAGIKIGSMEGGPTVESEAIAGRDIRHLAIDDAGRIWAGTEYALAVLDRKGRIVAQWTAGTLEGFTGEVQKIVVIGAGPARLPAPVPSRRWDVVGRLRLHKNSKPLAGASLELCPSSGGCAGAPYRKAAVTNDDGSFRFEGVLDGHFFIGVRPPPGVQDCETPFTVTGHFFTPARDCRQGTGAPGTCDLGDIEQCLPFEMPPPRR